MFQKNVENGYIISVVNGATNGNITENEYNTIMAAMDNRPIPPEGYDYRLKENMEWELYELPPVVEEEENTWDL